MITNKRIAIIALLFAALFYAGCIPEDSLEWSEDGSIGLLRIDESLYLVDGQSGQLTEVSKEGVQPWPDISADGSLIAYAQSIKFDSFQEGLQTLPDSQIKMIKYAAEKIKEAIIDANGLTNNEFPSPEDNILSNKKDWPIRYLCENAEGDLVKLLSETSLQQGKEMTLECFQVIVAPTNEPNNKAVIATNLLDHFKN